MEGLDKSTIKIVATKDKDGKKIQIVTFKGTGIKKEALVKSLGKTASRFQVKKLEEDKGEKAS
ncbi:MAG: hypothetical protein GWO24_27185 [Akkermansiaceae bacterium]|nr:hypothetical protein [Akkermansiaceae bacterium]